jgi:hypothetical protein
MKTLRIAPLLIALSAAGQSREEAGHLFRAQGRLTAPSGLGARDIARDFLRSKALDYHLQSGDLDAAAVVREYRTEHNGVTHFVYRQRFQGIDVENAEWTVNIDAEGRVINAGGRLARRPADGVEAPDERSARRAVRAAAGAVNSRLAERFAPLASEKQTGKTLRFAGNTFPGDIEAVPVWWSDRGELRPAWKFGITDADGISRWAVVVDGTNRRILAKWALTMRQAAPKGLVFEKGSPQPNPNPGVQLTAPPPVVERTVQSFAGDPAASPQGWVSGNETSGNNVVAGTNILGALCPAALDCLTRPRTAKAEGGVFNFPFDTKGSPALYPEASVTSLFYWANRAHDWFYRYGFNEAAGNFQVDNFGRGGVDGDPMYAYALFGTAAPGRADVNNAFYTSPLQGSDGAQSSISFLLETANNWFYDNSQDAPTVVHEYAHGVTSRLVRQLNNSFHGAAMGEGWSDFLAIEMLTPDGAPVDGVYPFSEYPDQLFGRGIRTRPYSTRLDVNPLTFAHLGRVEYAPEIHNEGEIWAEALWEMRASLIKQFGEAEGRRRTRQLVIDGLKLTPPAPSMIDARDAILLADQVTFKGENLPAIWAGFARRGMGALAMAKNGDSVHVRPSFDTPSARGSIQFYEDRYVIGERITIVVQDAGLTGDSARVRVLGTSGDVEDVNLRRKGQVFVGSIETNFAPVVRQNATLELIAGDFISAFYNDSNAPGGPHLANASVPVSLDYDWNLRANTALRFSGEQSLGLTFATYTPYELPWLFPFFGNRYKQVWVHNNGLLSFDFPNFSACPDPYGLWMTNGIAPMWMNLATDGSAQSGENVYVSRGPVVTDGPDWVTFRWAGETAPDFIGSRPEAVNFAATLYKDGRIAFQYGAGNRNLTAGSNWFGCSVSSPVVGISNGHESFIEPILTHDGKGTLENAQTVVLDPPFSASSAPVVKLESPAPDAKVKGVLSGAGIAYDPDPEGAIREVDVLIDGIAIAVATTGRSRTDFCAAQRVQGCPNVGFTFNIPLERNRIAPGPHTLQLRTVNRRGFFVDTPEKPMTIVVEADTTVPVSVIEAPTAGQEVSGTLAVRGYVYSASSRIANVDVLVDGVTFGRATYSTTRSEICGGLDPAPVNCPRVGFTYNLNTRALPDGPHTVAIRVVTDASAYSDILPGAVTFTVKNGPAAAAPVGSITFPSQGQKISGVVRFSGYAYAPAGAVSRVTLLIDGYPMMRLAYGSARAEACAGLSGIKACPNIGFEGDFDTRRLSNGPHYINVIVEDDKGGGVIVPDAIHGGIDVSVEN